MVNVTDKLLAPLLHSNGSVRFPLLLPKYEVEVHPVLGEIVQYLSGLETHPVGLTV